MELSQSSLGVRTRAKTLALQRLQTSSASTGGGSYLQLRSRRLLKPPILVHQETKKLGQQQGSKLWSTQNPNPITNSKVCLAHGSSSMEENNHGSKDNEDLVVEALFGENILDNEGRERSTRESTPCNLIRDPESVRSPGSSTRRWGSTDTSSRVQNSTRRHIPTAHEMDEFFAGAEEEQQRQFVDKYNFDPVDEKPLPGRYAWEKVSP